MNKLDFELAKLLIREQRYFSLKGFSRKNITRISRPISSYVRRNYIASVISFSILSLGLAAIKILEIPGSSTLSEVIVVLFFYLVIAGAYNALFYFSQIKMANIIEPSIHLPRLRTERALILSYIYYYGSSTLFVVLPAAFIYAFLFKNVIEFFIILWWSGIYSILALLAGSIALVATGGNMFRRKAGKKKYAKSIVRIAAILFAFFFFEFWIYDPSFLPPDLFDHFNAIIAFIPVFNISSTAFYSFTAIDSVISAFSLIVFTIMAVFALRYSIRIVGKFFNEPGNPRENNSEAKFAERKDSPGRALIRKDLAIVFRSPQNSVLMFLPLLLSLPVIIPIAISGSSDPLGIYYTMLEVPVICASFFPIVLLISEGRGISSVFSLPIDRLHFIGSKFAISLSIFLVMLTAIIVIIVAFRSEGILPAMITETAIFCGFTYTITLNFIKNTERINENVTILNFDSFGGNAGLMFTFMRSLALILLPVLASDLIVYSIFRSFSNYLLILSINLLFNIVIVGFVLLYAIRGIAGREIVTYHY